MEKIDSRIIKSKKNLLQALFILLKEKTFAEISVVDICEKAKINRMTFYNHYQDKYDLLADFLKTVKKDMSTSVERKCKGYKWPEDRNEYIVNFTDVLIDTVCANANILINVTKNTSEDISTYMIIKFCQDTACEFISSLELNEDITLPIPIVSSFISGGAAGIIAYWLAHKDTITKNQFREYAIKIITAVDNSDLIIK